MTTSGQSINDRLVAAKHSLAGQGLAKSVCKASTEEVMGPKKKHLDYLLHCTNEPNVSIPQLANLLIERMAHQSWVVVFKALITVHHLMCYGNERFIQYLASSNCNFQLTNFLDKTNVSGYDMSTYVRRYSKYLNEKALSYRTVAFDFCKVKRGKDEGQLRSMNAEKLLKTIPALQNQMDALLEFDCSPNELTNGVINTGFMLLFRDLIRLFACYNDGIINLLEKYFDMPKKNARDSLELYKRFLVRMDRVSEFLKVAESVGVEKSDIPDLVQAPSSLLEALEQHLATLEGKKGSGANTPTGSGGASVVGGSGRGSVTPGHDQNGVDDTAKRQALQEEQRVLEQLKEKRMKEQLQRGKEPPPRPATNPFLMSPAAQQPVVDFFSTETSTQRFNQPSDDLLGLSGVVEAAPPPASNNPFADPSFFSTPAPTQPPAGGPWGGAQNGFGSGNTNGSNAFVNDNAFASAFGQAPPSQASGYPMKAIQIPGFDAFGDILQPVSNNKPMAMGAQGSVPAQNSSGKILTGDLDMSLASLAQNLSIDRTSSAAAAMQKGSHQWTNSPKQTGKTGGANWQPQVASQTAGAPPAASQQSWNSPQHGGQAGGVGKPADWSGGIIGGHFPQQPVVNYNINRNPYFQSQAGVNAAPGRPAVPPQNVSGFDPFGDL